MQAKFDVFMPIVGRFNRLNEMVTSTLIIVNYFRRNIILGESCMTNITLIGIDLGKHSFHVHCQDISGKKIMSKKFTRTKLFEFLVNTPATVVVMEACAGSHFMARKIAHLGHEAKLISPQFVKPFVKSNKNDFVDAEAICEAASRPSMQFVQPKTESQQAMRAWHKIRESLVRYKVKTTNQMHAFSRIWY